MKATLILASLFAAFVAAAPAEIDARQARTIRVQLSQDATDTAVQANVPANGSRVPIKGTFRLGNPVQANRAGVVSGSGSCNIFRDAAAKQRVATIRSGGNDVNFGNTNLDNGVIVCQ
ncbi:hypothetical protein BKA66DRAFT_576185 [Pyrenochaeta sp. MPI-SDFR-AT-0127]|nr:hypothetical protein BKA66DRAFT_576185 [Pyrenochaeta sp. MPI-SDFR-AT-0127]